MLDTSIEVLRNEMTEKFNNSKLSKSIIYNNT